MENKAINTHNTDDAIYFNFSYSALKLLGKNLYSNAASAISELVANGLDAGAKHVYVYIDMSDKANSTVEILDDGIGMDYEDLQRKYVWVGRNKRNDLSDAEKNTVMGRKGIGKLAALYLTSTYSILTKKSEEKEDRWKVDMSVYADSDTPRLDRIENEVHIVNDVLWSRMKSGTAIVLENVDLRRNGTKRIEALRRVFADYYLTDDIGAEIYVAVKTDLNQDVEFERVQKKIAFKNFYAIYDTTSPSHYDLMKKSIAFKWSSKVDQIANKERPTKDLDVNKVKYVGEEEFETDNGNRIKKRYELKGWVGIHATIDAENAQDENFIRNNVYQPMQLRVYVRNKLAIANFLDIYPNTQAFSNYIEGDVSFDILDDDDLPDIATSSRQDFLDDRRVDILINILSQVVNQLIAARADLGKEIKTEINEYEEKIRREQEEKEEKEIRAKEAALEEARSARIEQHKAEEGKKKAEKKAAKERDRAEYILSVSQMEDKKLFGSMHSIYNWSVQVKDGINRVVSSETGEKNLNRLRLAAEANQNIVVLTKMIVKASKVLENNNTPVPMDIDLLIKKYIDDIGNTYASMDREIYIGYEFESDEPYEKVLKPIEFIVVLDNLIVNSSKARSTHIRIVTNNSSKSYYSLKVIDDGMGIDSQIQNIDRVFDFGYTTTDGSGLGLYYSKIYMVDQMKGDISLERNQDKGVTVELKFPKE